MPMPIEQLFVAPTVDEIFDKLITGLVALGLPADKWRKGGALRSALRVVAASFYPLALIITLFIRAIFLETSTGDFLTLIAKFFYGVVRIQSTFATGTILASNSSGNIYTFNPGEFIVQNATTKKSFKNVATFTLNPGDTDIPVDIEAIEEGTASNSETADITLLFTAADGVTVTNPLPVLASDAQSDADLRQTCLDKLGALSLDGPRGAYRFAIRTATLPDGTPVNVNRFSVSASSSTGIVTIYLASPSGAVTSTDIDAVIENIEKIARPDTARVNVLSVSVATAPLSLVIWARSVPGLDADALREQVTKTILDYVSSYPIGGIPKPPSAQGYLYDETIRAVAQSANAAIFTVDRTPSTDIAIATGTVVELVFVDADIDVRIVA